MIAMVEIDRGSPSKGVRLMAACSHGAAPLGSIHVPDVRVEAPAYLARARQALGEAAYAAAWNEGQATTLDQAVSAAVRQVPSASIATSTATRQAAIG